MRQIVFDVKESAVSANKYTWEAFEHGASKPIPLLLGGYEGARGNFVGRYPEIEQYLKDTYGITTSLAFVESVDSTQQRGDGMTWTFNRPELIVIVHDIHRTVLRVYSEIS